MPTLKLTEKAVAAVPPPADRAQEYYWDTDTKGFGVVVGRTGAKTFVARAWVGRKRRRVKIGVAGQIRDDGHTWNVSRARKRALELLAEMAGGGDPNAAKRIRRGGPTLRDALELHLNRLRRKGGRPRSISTIETEVTGYLADWLDRPLRDITRSDCRERHERLTDNNGPYVANRTLRHVRALWNTALREHDLPANPTVACHWNKQQRRQEPIPWTDLPAWYETVQGIDPVRRDYNMFVLLTGLRRMDAATIRWEHLDLDARTLHRPNPKGGKDRAFTIPLSRECVKILERRRAENRGDAGWVFPTRAMKDRDCDHCSELGQPPHRQGAATHLIELKEQRIDKATRRAVQILPTPHRLRDTYTTACAEVRPALSPYDIDVLTNHRPPRGSVTAGYINLSGEHLAECQERVSGFLMAKIQP